ncbi:MAG: tRNA dihydrouridine synthase DusB [Bacillota bacterium]
MLKENTFIKPIKLKNVQIKNNVFLAPLAGVTDIGFRKLAKDFGAGLTVTEMVSAKGLMYKNKNTAELMKTSENETPKVLQLFGSDPTAFECAINHPDVQKFDIIDINFGCPVGKIVSNGEGSFLMTNPKQAEKVILSLTKNTDKPITAKFRLGYTDNDKNYIEFGKMCEGSGISMVTLHGRTREMMYSGTSDVSAVGNLKNALQIPVVGNGDIFCKKSAQNMLEKTGCDGIMVARGAMGMPWIFSEILGDKITKTRSECMREHFELLAKSVSEKFACLSMRKHFCWYLKGLHGSNDCKNQINTLQTKADIENFINFVENNPHFDIISQGE